MPKAYLANAQWDLDAGLWIAKRQDMPGPCAQASGMEVLVEVVNVLVAKPLEINQAKAQGASL